MHDRPVRHRGRSGAPSARRIGRNPREQGVTDAAWELRSDVPWPLDPCRLDPLSRTAASRGARLTTEAEIRWVWSGVPNLAQVALERTQAIVARLPDVERSDNPVGCYFLVRRKIFAQVATVIDPGGQPATMVVLRPDPDEREALIAIGRPYFSRGPWDERLGRIAVVIEATTDWDEIAELVTDSYRQTAPKKLVAQLDSSHPRIGNE